MTSPYKREGKTPEPEASSETVILRSRGTKNFVVHARPLAHLSKYFRTALNSGFQEASKREFELDVHCNEEILRIFTSWVYMRSSGVTYQTDELPFLQELAQKLVIKAWLFGDYVQAPAFQNDMMILMVGVGNRQFDPKLFRIIGSSIPKDSALEEYFVDRFCSLLFHHPRRSMDWMMNRLPKNLIDGVCRQLATLIWDQEKWVGGRFYDWKNRKAREYEVQEEGGPY
ncbi:hypothetical protein F5Y09DRAFT_342476 [Xylaria sp. FL1042]|nr:hypothetical protein F5Y09DRAFT_342476 [Xylaria sp. FL1042]